MKVTHGQLQRVNNNIWKNWKELFWQKFASPLVCIGAVLEDGKRGAFIATVEEGSVEEAIKLVEDALFLLKESQKPDSDIPVIEGGKPNGF